MGDLIPKRQLVGSGRVRFLVLLRVNSTTKIEAIFFGRDFFVVIFEDGAIPMEVDADSVPIPDEVSRCRFPKSKSLPSIVDSTTTFSIFNRSIVCRLLQR